MHVLLEYQCEVNPQVQISTKTVHQKIRASLQLASHLYAKIKSAIIDGMQRHKYQQDIGRKPTILNK